MAASGHSLAAEVLVGLAVTSHSDGALSTARFENVRITAAPTAATVTLSSLSQTYDGMPKPAEFALGSDPRQFTAPLATSVDQNGLSLTFTRPVSLQGVSYGAESSGDLVTWTPVPLELLATGTTETLRARAPVGTGDPSRGFLRLRFEGPDPPAPCAGQRWLRRLAATCCSSS